MTFHGAPFPCSKSPFAVLVFAWLGERVLVCDIEGRGWTVPIGRVEPGETPLAAAERELAEEGAARLESWTRIGCYRIGTGRAHVLALESTHRAGLPSFACVAARPPCLRAGSGPRGATLSRSSRIPALADVDPKRIPVDPFQKQRKGVVACHSLVALRIELGNGSQHFRADILPQGRNRRIVVFAVLVERVVHLVERSGRRSRARKCDHLVEFRVRRPDPAALHALLQHYG
ncbi:MAG: NUDIX domain-containing protein [Fimbriimonas ginsengisoli]|nr:NUDIX domain-containing protein [Fimbriimonas ginsengisoli]